MMYNSYFGFKEKPFKLVPDPSYLYLSKGHDAVLAKLNNAIEQGDGFILITGEVGTGKTTLCRVFLERISSMAESAYIFNTQLDNGQLIQSICSEFGIDISGRKLAKELLDSFNDHLIKIYQKNKKAILVIDEAQNLSVDNLEMVRMLSNLETTRYKLLQIVLVGQPELEAKLESYELRQLSQRISLSAELKPLSEADTAIFIKHRANIAAQRQLDVFTAGAFKKIYRYSGGIPRLINIAADRALMAAYELKRPKVTASIANLALRDARASKRFNNLPLKRNRWLLAVSCLIIFIAFGLGYFGSKTIMVINKQSAVQGLDAQKPEEHAEKSLMNIAPVGKEEDVFNNDEVIQTESISNRAVQQPVEKVNIPQSKDINKIMDGLESRSSRLAALAQLLVMWQQPLPHPNQFPDMVEDATYYQIAALQYGMQMLIIHTEWDLVARLNLPAIVALSPSESNSPVYLTLIGRSDDLWRLSDGNPDHTVDIDQSQLASLSTGPVYIFWNNLLGYNEIISHGAPAQTISELKHLLRLSGYSYVSTGPNFDLSTKKAVIDFQKKNNIDADGLVGPLTKILLINRIGTAQLPKLDQTMLMTP